VASFDAAVGLGTVDEDGPGAGTYPFHCTQIADGTRTIEVGTPVAFNLMPARHGRVEAIGLTGLALPL
jgi:CspA family cold shock protein